MSRSVPPSRYAREFDLAVKRSFEYRLITTAPTVESGPLIGQDSEALCARLFQALGSPKAHKLFGECLSVSYQVAGYLRQQEDFGQAYFTIGYLVNSSGYRLYPFTDKDIQKWMKDGIDPIRGADVHAWVTLPSLEIIDLTIGYVEYAPAIRAAQKKRVHIDVPAKHYLQYPDTIDDYRYYPMLVGERFLIYAQALGGIWSIPLRDLLGMPQP